MSGSKYVPLFLVSCALAVAACDDGQPSSFSAAAGAPGVSLLQCTPAQEQTFTGSAGLHGGVLEGAGVSVVIPAGALLRETNFRVTVPATQYAEIDVTANGQEHFQFLRPVILTIDYSRCAADPLAHRSVWYIDSETKTPLEEMGGIDDVIGRRMIFSTVHLSGYAIAN